MKICKDYIECVKILKSIKTEKGKSVKNSSKRKKDILEITQSFQISSDMSNWDVINITFLVRRFEIIDCFASLESPNVENNIIIIDSKNNINSNLIDLLNYLSNTIWLNVVKRRLNIR